MVKLNVQELLEKKGKTKFWLYNQLGMSYQNFNRLINNQTKGIRFSTMEDIDRRAVMQLIRSIRVMGKDELHIEFNYQDEYQKAISLAEQIATKNEERMVG